MVTMVGDNIIELRRLFTDYQAFDKKVPLRFEMRLANSRFTVMRQSDRPFRASLFCLPVVPARRPPFIPVADSDN
jgi:hypothetical protein